MDSIVDWGLDDIEPFLHTSSEHDILETVFSPLRHDEKPN